MTSDQTKDPVPARRLRLWPGVVAAVVLLAARLLAPHVVTGGMMYAVLGALAGALAIVVWWLFFSRVPWSERLGLLALMAVALAATSHLVHVSIRTGMMGMMFFLNATPLVAVALVVGVAAARRLGPAARRASAAVAILLACGAWTLVRTEGISGDGDSDLEWRWSPTPEERLLAQAPLAPAVPPSPGAAGPAPGGAAETSTARRPAGPASPAAEAPGARPPSPAAVETAAPPSPPQAAPKAAAPEWPGFRGPERDGVVHGARVATDWAASPPVELWRRPIGPGWSSFAVRGNLLYTQEQRGGEEVVACYDMTTAEPVWTHRDPARFYESNAGPGPRATPTLSNGRVYTFGATGIVNALDADDGTVVWSRSAAADTGRKVPAWGFASSPLVLEDLVIVAAAADLVAYDLATGEPRWFGPKGGWGYSSPHLATIDGVRQVLLLNGTGAIGVAPVDGRVLWEHRWAGDSIVQPGLTADGDVLIGSGTGMGSAAAGMRRVAVNRGSEGWTVEERWTSIGLKPYFNDFVVHEGHAFGFDGGILACISLQDGERKWKGGRYGHGQLVLLPDQDLLLVLSEEGELALVRAAPDRFEQLARVPAIEGKTWNHPVLAGDVLLIRNGEEMAAFRLARLDHSARP